jgi:hypothetical protein
MLNVKDIKGNYQCVEISGDLVDGKLQIETIEQGRGVVGQRLLILESRPIVVKMNTFPGFVRHVIEGCSHSELAALLKKYDVDFVEAESDAVEHGMRIIQVGKS